MNEAGLIITELLQKGFGNLAAYLAAHVLLCLVPAFFIAGAMTALIPKEAITRFLGRGTASFVSYPAAAAAGSLLAVCSCTIVPLFAGIYRKGAGLGPAITFLFFAPAANILALVYTGGVIGVDLASARFVLSLVFGIGIGLIMALIFRKDDAAHDLSTDELFAARNAAGMSRPALAFLALWIALLLAGTLKLAFLADAVTEVTLPMAHARQWQSVLDHLVPNEASRGEEGLSLQGVLLIALIAAIAACAWKGLEYIENGITAWTLATLGLIAVTLLLATLSVNAVEEGISIGLTGRTLAVAACFALLATVAKRSIGRDEIQAWLWESWLFMKQIFPLLVMGVFIVGMLRAVIRPEWIETVAGENSVLGNLAGVAFGVFMYFPTLVEVPIAKMFLELGMHRGPLLAYLMADPELSLQSILIIAAVIGRRKAWTYVGLVALFSVVAGLTYGAWIDGTPLSTLALALAAFVGLLVLLVRWADNHTRLTPQQGD